MKLYKIIYQNKPIGFPKILQLKSASNYNFMLMELLGPSLDDIFIRNNKTFSLKTVL